MIDVHTEFDMELSFAGHSPEAQAAADREMRDVLLKQASRKGYAELLRVAVELGGDVDVVVRFKDLDCHVKPVSIPRGRYIE